MNDQERAAFEAWGRAEGLDDSNGYGMDYPLGRQLWAAWQAGRAAPAAPQAPLTDEQWLKRWTGKTGQRLKPGPERDRLLSLFRFAERAVRAAGVKEPGHE